MSVDVSTTTPTSLDELCGHGVALATLIHAVGDKIPGELTTAAFSTAKALLQPHSKLPVFDTPRKALAFVLFETLIQKLGPHWAARRLTALFSLWKTVLGKKAVDAVGVEDCVGQEGGGRSRRISARGRQGVLLVFKFVCVTREAVFAVLRERVG